MARIETRELTVQGEQTIHCESCENRIETVLSRLPGVLQAKADHTDQKISLRLDTGKTNLDKVRERLTLMGYEVTLPDPATPRN